MLAGAAALVVPCALARAQAPAEELRTAGADEEPDFQVDSAASGGWYSLAYPPGSPSTHGNREALSMSLTAFEVPLRDDDSPYTLQPFMQRESSFTLSFSGGRFDTTNPYGGVDRTEWNAGIGASFDAYLKRWLAVFGGASYGYFDLHDVDVAQTGHTFSASAGAGIRYGNTRVNLSGGGAVDRTAGAFGSWRRNLTLSAFSVIRRRVGVNVSGTLVQGGEEGSVDVEVYPTKGTGVFASAFAGRYEPYSDPIFVTRYVGSVGFAGWFDATTALVGQYSLLDETDPATSSVTIGYRQLSHTLSIEAYFRFR